MENKDQLISNGFKFFWASVIFLTILAVIVFVFFKKSKSIDSQELSQISKNKSIAVLAFLDMSPEQDQAYFSDGMSEEILNRLAQIPELKVISRTSSFFYKGKSLTTKEISEELEVSHILEGSVRKYEDKVRITVQLIESDTSAHLWSETYDEDMNDVFRIQDSISQAVSKKLKLSLLEKSKESKKADLEAYNTYLQAKHLIQKSSLENYK